MVSVNVRSIALASALAFSPTNSTANTTDPFDLSLVDFSAVAQKDSGKKDSGKKEPGTDAPIVLKIDTRTMAPVGELVPPRGVLLDPRDIPDAIKPHLDICKGLSGYESSLSALFGRNIGFIVERPNIGKQYEVACSAMRESWNSSVSQLIAQLDPKNKKEGVFSALYYDTGRRLSSDNSEVTVVNAPRIKSVPVSRELFNELIQFEVEILKLGSKMPQAEAKALLDKIEAIKPEVDLLKEPWFHHAKSQLMFLSLGAYSDELVKNNPFKYTEEQFFAECHKALKRVLIDPKIPPLPENNRDGALYFYEGYAVAQSVSAATLKSGWPSPTELTAYNSATHHPMLLIQVPESGKYAVGTKFKEVELAMILNGEKRVLYNGSWPMK